MNILEEIAEKTTERIRKEKEEIPLFTVRSAAEKRRFGAPDFLFEKALKKPGVSFICEVKKASPSKGIIAEDFPYLDIARSYEAAGADAISCLTEPFYFLGRDAYLQEISASVSIPVLRKDFTIDEYMIYQAAAYGASAVLLICSILDDEKLLAYRQLADELKLSALVETHSEEEISRAVKAGARIIGVNNRLRRTVFSCQKAGSRPVKISKSWKEMERMRFSSGKRSCVQRIKKPCWTA